MTVSTINDRITYLADGSTVNWTIPFPPVNASFISVFIIDSIGTITSIPSNQFTVTINPPLGTNPTPQNGSVLYPLVGSPLATGNSISIVRTLPALQTVSISNQSIVYPPIIEQEFDYLTMLSQSEIGGLVRVFKVGETDPVPAVVPPVQQRASKTAFFDSFGNLTGGAIPSPGVFISAPMIPVVEGGTLDVARNAMGVPPINNPVFTGDPQAPTPPATDNDTSIATTAFVQAALNLVFTTGDLKPTHKTVADSGWIMWVDGTIGDASSGSSLRSNADTVALFTLYYNNYTDANCPLLTSSGASTTRASAGTAAAAYAAHCRMTLPRSSGRALALSGQGAGLTNRVIGSFNGEETHTQSISEMAFHGHGLSDAGHAHSLGGGQQIFVGGNVGNVDTGTQFPVAANQNVVNATDSNTANITVQGNGSGAAFNVMQPSTYINVMVKL